MANCKIFTAPALEPVALDEAKNHLRIDTSPATAHPDDGRIQSLITTARRFCEGFQGRSYITQTWDFYCDRFSGLRFIEFPFAPLQSLVSMTYKDAAGVQQTISFMDGDAPLLATADYIVDTVRVPGRLTLRYGKCWPTTYPEVNAVQIRFVCGYGDPADVPSEVKDAMLLKIADLYEHHGDGGTESITDKAVKSLLWPERIIGDI